MKDYLTMPKPKLSIGERWCNSFLVTYPTSYTYNGGIVVKDKWYKGFKVPSPKVPKGFKLVGIGIGSQLNARPPYATVYLKPNKDTHKITRKELKALIG
jgi:hypothetical protein